MRSFLLVSSLHFSFRSVCTGCMCIKINRGGRVLSIKLKPQRNWLKGVWKETMRYTKNSYGITKERMIIIYPDRISIKTQGSAPLSWKSKMKSLVKRVRQVLAALKTMGHSH